MSTDETTPISSETEAAATTRADLPRRDLALVGTLTGGDAPRALLRTGGGRFLTRVVGERVGRETVVGIGDGEVILSRGGETYSLKMPPG